MLSAPPQGYNAVVHSTSHCHNTPTMPTPLLCIITGIATALGVADQPAHVEIEFVVTVPGDTPTDAAPFVAGNRPELGNWRADGLPLIRNEDGRFHARLNFPDGAEVEYKITLGDWTRVERDASGRDVSNRRFTAASRLVVRAEVASWGGARTQSAASAPTPATQPGASTPSTRRPSRTGDIRLHEYFRSRLLSNERTLAIYLPPDYTRRPSARYPVLYMHDGQNLFDAATSFLGVEWQADEHAERLIRAGRIEPIIIVGIYNTPDRMHEYTPQADAQRDAGGRGRQYARFLVEEVKPFIDKTYRTIPDRAHTAVAGSSLGGLISLYLAREHREVFSQCGVVSPALMWADAALLKEVEGKSNWMAGTRFWLDMGTDEGRQIGTFNRAIELTRRLERAFLAAGLITGRDYYYAEIHEGQHNEAAWAARFDRMLLFFYGRSGADSIPPAASQRGGDAAPSSGR